MNRRSFLSTLTACLAALGVRRKAEACEPKPSHVATWDGRKVLFDDGPPVGRYYFYDTNTGKREPLLAGPPVTINPAFKWSHIPPGSRIVRGGRP